MSVSGCLSLCTSPVIEGVPRLSTGSSTPATLKEKQVYKKASIGANTDLSQQIIASLV